MKHYGIHDKCSTNIMEQSYPITKTSRNNRHFRNKGNHTKKVTTINSKKSSNKHKRQKKNINQDRKYKQLCNDCHYVDNEEMNNFNAWEIHINILVHENNTH